MNTLELKKQIQDSGMSQNEVARKLDISIGYMSRIVNGKQEPRIDLFKNICKLFNKNPKEMW